MNPANSQINRTDDVDRAFHFHWPKLVFFALATILLAVTGCRSDAGSPPVVLSEPPVPGPAAVPDYPGAENYFTNDLHEGDVIKISFQYSTNFDAVQKVALDGTLNLNMVGREPAAGRTVTQLQQELTRAYDPFAKGDIITVELINSGAIVYVSGAVLRPGPVELDHPLTVLEAVMASGGFDNTRARLSNVTVLRIVDGKQEAYHINLNRILAGRDDTPFYLQSYDIIYVPAKIFNY
ncbi:MAG TPA: SLBB domain-containing protein [Verrucomicrobiae bacterium]|jgi:polysaccharide export outer membrane protein